MIMQEIPEEVRADILRRGSNEVVFSMLAESLFQELEETTVGLYALAELIEAGHHRTAAAAARNMRERIGQMLMKSAVMWANRRYPWRERYGIREH